MRRPWTRVVVFAVAFALSWNVTGAVYYSDAVTDLALGIAPTCTTLNTFSSSGMAPGTTLGFTGTCSGPFLGALANVTDGNDATRVQMCGESQSGCTFIVDLGSSQLVTAYRYREFDVCGAGPNYIFGGGVFATSTDGVTYTVADNPDAFNCDTGVVNLGLNSANARYVAFMQRNPGCAGGCRFMGASFEAYGSTVPTAPIGNYVRGLNVTQMGTGVSFTWSWVLGFTGTTTITGGTTGSNGTTAGYPLVNGIAGQSGNVLCSTSGGHSCTGPWTLTVNDTGRNLQATYVIAADASGTVIGDVTQPGITGISGCYNATANQCGAGQSADTVNITYAIKVNPQGEVADVAIGPEDVNQGSIIGAPPPYVAYGKATGVTVVTGLAVTGVTGPWLITLAGRGGFASVQFNLSVGGGSFVGNGTVGAGGPLSAVCGPLDVVCAVRNVPGQIAGEIGHMLQYLLVPGLGTSTALNDFVNVMKAHEPFSTITASLATMQLYAAHSTSAAPICLNLAMHMVPGSGAAQNPGLCFNVITGHAEWGTIRSLMGWFVYSRLLLWAWSWYRSSIAPEQLRMSWS